MEKLIVILMTLLTLSGCGSVSDLLDKAADVNDEALLSAEFTICSAASTGAIQRRYSTQELLLARKVICTKSIEVLEEKK